MPNKELFTGDFWGRLWECGLDTNIISYKIPKVTGLVSEEETQLCPAAAAAKSLQSCPTLCDPIDGSPPGSPVPGILQARILEWVAISFSNA